MNGKQQHHSTCPLCEAACGIVVETRSSAVVSIRGDKEDPASKGFICPKVMGLVDLHEDPDRLRTPKKRVGDSFVDVSWKEALDEIGKRTVAIRRAHGADAVGVYQGNPTVHNLGLLIFGQLLFRSLGSRNLFSATSTDQLPHMLAALKMFGNHVLLPVPDIDRTDLMVMIGGNPVVSGGSLMTAPGFAKRAEALRTRGGRLVVIDPRRTETAKIADQHIAVVPGTDAYLLLAMLEVIFAEGLSQAGRVGAFTEGLETLEKVASAFPPERVADFVGVSADTIRTLAREVATTKRAVVYGRIGACQQEFAGLVTWLINAVNIATGHLDEIGCSMFATPAVDLARMSKLVGFAGSYARYRSRASDLPEFGGELPVAALAEEIELTGKRQIRALFTSAGNPVLSIPNGPKLERALPGLELMVSLDFYINETTRYADFILPPTSALEREHYDLAFGALMVRNHAKYTRAVFAKPDGAMHDWEICIELGRRIFGSSIWRRPAARAIAALAKLGGPRTVIAAGLRAGPFGLRLSEVEDNRHGLDLGPLEPRLPKLLGKRGSKISVAPGIYISDVARLEAKLGADAGGGLVLIGRRQLRSNNSWMHNCRRLVKGKPRCTLLIHPDDAASRGLATGDLARLTSRVGTIEVPVEVSDDMMIGVVSLPHGWGHHREGAQLSVAAEFAGVSVNDITDERSVDPLSGNAAYNGISVTVAAAASVGQVA